MEADRDTCTQEGEATALLAGSDGHGEMDSPLQLAHSGLAASDALVVGPDERTTRASKRLLLTAGPSILVW
jgi:hypothetical protein